MGKSFQERVKDLEEYNPNITFKDGAFILRIQFKKSWSIMEPDNPDEVAYGTDDHDKTWHIYVSTIENSDKVFDLIDETIAVNREMEKKVSLYKEKVKELQELFLSDIPYDKLVQIQFTFPEKKGKNKKGKTQASETNEISETNETTPKNTETNSIINNVVEDTEPAEEKGTSYIDQQIAKVIGG